MVYRMQTPVNRTWCSVCGLPNMVLTKYSMQASHIVTRLRIGYLVADRLRTVHQMIQYVIPYMGIPNMVRLKRITICVNIANHKRYTICDGIFRKFTWRCVASLTLMNFSHRHSGRFWVAYRKWRPPSRTEGVRKRRPTYTLMDVSDPWAISTYVFDLRHIT